jgi:hypothetical protein
LQLPPPPQIELILEKPNLGVLRRPLVRIRREYCLNFDKYSFYFISSFFCTASSNSEVLTHKAEEKYLPSSTKIKSQTPVAVIKKNLGADSMHRGTLACTIPWGYGWGYVTLPNGIWNGKLTFAYGKYN